MKKVILALAISSVNYAYSQNPILTNPTTANGQNEQLSIVNLDLNNPNLIPARRGIGIGKDGNGIVDGRFNFYTHAWQGGSFNFLQNTGSSPLTKNLMSIKSNGVGIGTDAPLEKLHIEDGNINLNLIGTQLVGGNFNGAYVGTSKIRFSGRDTEFSIEKNIGPFNPNLSIINSTNNFGMHLYRGNSNTNIIVFGTKMNGNPPTASNFQFIGSSYFKEKMSIGLKKPNGIYSDYMLSVDGTIVAREVLIEDVAWADYVFNSTYKLKSIDDVQKFITLNNHLPDVPSEAELKETGLNVAEMQKIQMQKIEELTLYVIQLNEENKKLQLAIENLTK